MTTTRSSAKHGFPRGRRIGAALLVSTLAGTALVACGADAKGAQPAKVSGKSLGGALAGLGLAARLHEHGGAVLAHDEDPAGGIRDHGGADEDPPLVHDPKTLPGFRMPAGSNTRVICLCSSH